jgi:hypothetical protein
MNSGIDANTEFYVSHARNKKALYNHSPNKMTSYGRLAALCGMARVVKRNAAAGKGDILAALKCFLILSISINTGRGVVTYAR